MQPHPPLPDYYRTLDEKPEFVRELFDAGAVHYDGIVGWGFFGSGKFYRRWAQQRAGLRPGMRVIDVAAGTGLMAAAAAQILGKADDIVCVDPSPGMLAEVAGKVQAKTVVGRAEALPVGDAEFDFLTMGYALRHVTALEVTFQEYFRVLRPGGRVLILEVTKPRSGFRSWCFDFYFRRIYPGLTRIFTRSLEAQRMMAYFWSTMDAVVPPEEILAAMTSAGFQDVRRITFAGGLFSEYVATKPAAR